MAGPKPPEAVLVSFPLIAGSAAILVGTAPGDWVPLRTWVIFFAGMCAGQICQILASSSWRK